MMGDAKHETRAVFTGALALSTPEERARYLDEACQGKPELRQRVEVLLRAHEQASSFLEEPAAPTPRKTVVFSPPLTEKPGDKIGHYKLLEEIGEGAFGRVFMAEQTEPVQRKVALKIIKAGMDTREVIARFEAERQALALMDHPNIAKVLDAGATETGRPYFVMELVRGIPITAYCEQQQLPTAGRLQLFMKVCHAVQHAHQKGIIHRDLKPTNILVTVIDGEAVPKVIDFGIAKALGQKLTEKTLFTAFQQMVGTPAYMSPEQATLSGVDVDTRSDIYSLGVLLYELLTGVTPFDQETLRKAALDEICRLIRETEPPKPSTRLTELARNQKSEIRSQQWKEVHGDLDWIVMKCLEKDRARRYETANSLADDIERHLKLEPVNAVAPSALYLAGKFIRRHKAGLATATALVLLMVAGAVVSTWQAVRATRAEREQTRLRQQAQADKNKAQTEAQKSQQVSQFLKDMLQGVSASVAQGRDTTLLKEILDKTAARLGTKLTNQPEAELQLRDTLGGVYWDIADWNQAIAMHRRSLELTRELRGGEDVTVAESMRMLGELLNRSGRFAEAESLDRQALAIYQKRFGREHATVGVALTSLGDVLGSLGRHAEAEATLRQAVAINQKFLDPENADFGESMHRLGRVLAAQGKLAEAETYLRNGTKILRKALYMHSTDGSIRNRLAWGLAHLADVLSGQGRLAEAEAVQRDAVATVREFWGDGHLEVAEQVVHLADILRAEGKISDMELLYRDLVERGNAWPLNNLAWRLATSSDPQLRDGQNAVRVAEKAVAATGRGNGQYLDTLAAAYAEAGRFADAVNVQQEAMALMQDEEWQKEFASRLRLYESGSPYRDHYALDERTRTLLAAGKSAEAEPLARECLALREKQIPEVWRTFDARSMLGASLLGQKKYAEAEPLLLSGYEGMKQRESQIPPAGRPRLKETLQRLVQLYDAMGRADQVAEWKQKLAEFEKAETGKQPATPPR